VFDWTNIGKALSLEDVLMGWHQSHFFLLIFVFRVSFDYDASVNWEWNGLDNGYGLRWMFVTRLYAVINNVKGNS
jgi:hypothetical protein